MGKRIGSLFVRAQGVGGKKGKGIVPRPRKKAIRFKREKDFHLSIFQEKKECAEKERGEIICSEKSSCESYSEEKRICGKGGGGGGERLVKGERSCEGRRDENRVEKMSWGGGGAHISKR